MPIRLKKETEKRLAGSIKRFFKEELDEDIGDLKAQLVLDFILKEVGPSVYNQAVLDAQAYFQERTNELGDVRHEAEFDYWRKGKA